MAKKQIEDLAVKLGVLRFLKVVIPQAVLFIPYVTAEISGYNLPAWVAPTLVFVGAVVTGLDKLLRELGFYDETPLEKMIVK